MNTRIMYTLVFAITITAGCSHLDSADTVPTPTESIRKSPQPLRLVFYQDLSGSIFTNGVEVVTADAFLSLYGDTSRDIELYFGIIEDVSTKMPLALYLPKPSFKGLPATDFDALSANDLINAKKQFSRDMKQHQADSVEYFQNRENKIRAFVKSADSVLAVYKKKKIGRTDIQSAVRIADKIFNYSKIDSAKNYLILNSDGKDTYKCRRYYPSNFFHLIVVNESTSSTYAAIDNLMPKTYATLKQAIQVCIQ